MSALLKAALADASAADALARQEATRQAELTTTADRCAAERRDLERTAAEREADALVSGQSVPEPPLAEVRRRDKLAREARAAEAAARKIGELLGGPIAGRQRAAQAAVTDAALVASREMRDGALAAYHAALEASIPSLASMIAAQHLRDKLAGLTFDFDGARHPPSELWNGGAVARKFIESMPSRLRPAGLADRIEAEAASLLAALLTDLEPAK